MLGIEKVDHIGIRISDKQKSVDFYEVLGFKLLGDSGFEKGHPIFMQHPSGVTLNLLGSSTSQTGKNILMDVEDKHPGITHVSFKISSMEDTRIFLSERGIPLSGEFSFKGMDAVFIRDPDRNVIELDAYEGKEPEARVSSEGTQDDGNKSHP